MISLRSEDFVRFETDGFVVIENVLSGDQMEAARERFPKLFRGEFETGVEPDEWNWREGRDSEELTRQICNGWKSDKTIASIVLAEDVGMACARLRGWRGARVNQDNVIWKPVGAKALGFHQDESYQTWNQPGEMMTFWLTLDDTHADQGTIEYARGSHKWALSGQIHQFHAPDDPLADLMEAAKTADETPDLVPIEVHAGSAVVHHGKTWHGSRENHGSNPRRSLVTHCMNADSVFDPEVTSPVYSKYKKPDSLEMNERAFPILWTADGRRSTWLDRV